MFSWIRQAAQTAAALICVMTQAAGEAAEQLTEQLGGEYAG